MPCTAGGRSEGHCSVPRGLADVALSVSGGTCVQCLIYLQFRKLARMDGRLLREHLRCLGCLTKHPDGAVAASKAVSQLTGLGTRCPRSRCRQSWFLLRPLPLACRCVFTLTWRSPWASASVLMSPFHKDTSHIGLGPP